MEYVDSDTKNISTVMAKSCRANNKNNISSYERKAIQAEFVSHGKGHIIVSLWYGFIFIVNKKCQKKYTS